MKKVAAGSVRRLAMAAGSFAVLLVVCMAGCRKDQPAPDANAPAGGQPSGAVTPADSQPGADAVMAVVDGDEIRQSQVKQRVTEEYGPVLAQAAAIAPELGAQHEKDAMKKMVNQLVIEHLLDAEARKAGIEEITEEQLVAEMTGKLAAATPPQTLEEFQKKYEAQGRSFVVLKANLARQMKYLKLLEANEPNSLTVTEDEAKKYYDENPDDFKIPEQVQASHILISTDAADPNADPNQAKAKARAKAESLLKQVKEGADFATLAKENSACNSAPQGGELGTFGRGQMVKPFEEAAFGLKVGEISDVVETEFGFHIIKVTGHQDPNTVPFAKAKDQLLPYLKKVKLEGAFANYIKSLQEKATITYTSDEAPAVQPPVAPAPQK